MPKQKIKYVCGECGYESTQFPGRCPGCNTWNSLKEEKEQTTVTALQRLGLTDIGIGSQASEADDSSGKPRASFFTISDF